MEGLLNRNFTTSKNYVFDQGHNGKILEFNENWDYISYHSLPTTFTRNIIWFLKYVYFSYKNNIYQFHQNEINTIS
jgi:hypothetical protein